MPFGCQNGEPGECSDEMEEVEIATEPAVVTRPGLLETLEMRVEIGLGEERRPVDPRQLRVLLVATPVRPREPSELQGADRGGVLQVRATAKIGEGALGVERDRTVGLPGELDLVRLVLTLEPGNGLLAGDFLALPRAPLGELAPHLLLDRGEIVFRDRLRELEVVVEAVGDRRGRSRS